MSRILKFWTPDEQTKGLAVSVNLQSRTEFKLMCLFGCLHVQNEALNGGGMLFVDKHPNLKVRVVHGNTLTAAVILNEIPSNVKEVFLTGATSKLGRAIALYLCRKKIRVLVRAEFFRFMSITCQQ
jgi:hypothetical protein